MSRSSVRTDPPSASTPVEVSPLRDELADVLGLLDSAERAGVPLVDEAERARLDALEAGADAAGWYRWVAHRDDELVGYLGILLPEAGQAEREHDAAHPGGQPASPDQDPALALGDLAVPRGRRADPAVLLALLARAADVAERADCTVELWLRDAEETDVETVTSSEVPVTVQRRLGVLGRDLTEAPSSVPGPTIRSYRPGEDDAAVVEVLAAAYAGTDDGGWDLPTFRERRRFGWFDPADLLLAVDDADRPFGLHWLKRRDAATGEVYNLAVHPRAQGAGAGPTLLAAGLRHLHATGCREVLLWVDLANERAVQLYRRQGFETRWVDVALRLDRG
jgi:mycothiol synthase